MQKIAYKHYLRALSRWPKDPLRPDIQFQDAIRRRTDRRLGLTKPEEGKDSQPSSQTRATIAWNEKEELAQANVLYSLLENRYQSQVTFFLLLIFSLLSFLVCLPASAFVHSSSVSVRFNSKETSNLTCTLQYPITNDLLKPAFNPTYYTDLIRELEEAPRRTWWERVTNRWKGFLRFK